MDGGERMSLFPSEQATACAFKPSVTALNCKEHTESTSGTSRLNSSKHPHAPEDAKPVLRERRECDDEFRVALSATQRLKLFRVEWRLIRRTPEKGRELGYGINVSTAVYTRAKDSMVCVPTFENVTKTLVVHLRGAVEDVAALPKTGGEVLRCLGFPRASWTGRGTPHLQMKRLHVLIHGGKSSPGRKLKARKTRKHLTSSGEKAKRIARRGRGLIAAPCASHSALTATQNPHLSGCDINPVRQGCYHESGAIPEKLETVLKRSIENIDRRQREFGVGRVSRLSLKTLLELGCPLEVSLDKIGKHRKVRLIHGHNASCRLFVAR